MDDYLSYLIIRFSFFQISSRNKNGTGTLEGSSPILIKTKLFEGIILTYCPFFPIPKSISAGPFGEKLPGNTSCDSRYS
jgi:hypothetical protein